MILKVCLFVRNTFMLTTKCSSRFAGGRCAPVVQTIRRSSHPSFSGCCPLIILILFLTSTYIFFLASLPSLCPSATRLDYQRRTVHMAPRRGLCYLLLCKEAPVVSTILCNATLCLTMQSYRLSCCGLNTRGNWSVLLAQSGEGTECLIDCGAPLSGFCLHGT